MKDTIILREVIDSDLPFFFEQQRDPLAVHMAAFTAKDPQDKSAFEAHWQNIRSSTTTINRSIIVEGEVAGYVSSYENDGQPEVTYWIDRKFWGRGLTSQALQRFLSEIDTRRPMLARVAKDNYGSIRVLGKCGFRVCGESFGFANARG
jgi:RimJ/RimL family protein N-acetyltransferase